MPSTYKTPGKGRRKCFHCGLYTASSVKKCAGCGKASPMPRRKPERRKAKTKIAGVAYEEGVVVVQAGAAPDRLHLTGNAEEDEPLVHQWAQKTLDRSPETSNETLMLWLSSEVPHKHLDSSRRYLKRWIRLFR